MSASAAPWPRPVYRPGVKPEPPPARSNPVMAGALPVHPEVQRMSEERRLIARAQAGDTGAFRVLVDQHRARAYTLALRILRSAADAEEVAQDAFVRVWTALPGFRGESSFATWLHRIVARRAFDRAQVLKNRRAREQQEDRLPEPAAPVTDDADTLQAAVLQRLVAGLSPAQRAAVTLFYHEGRSVEQVAEILGMPENTVKTHLLRARAALRSAWTHAVGEER
jgi:RNA polymerase sigma-70 factor (ECF subfamily)